MLTHLHLAAVALAHLVALEAVLIAARLLAQLAVPAQLGQPLGLDAVGDLGVLVEGGLWVGRCMVQRAQQVAVQGCGATPCHAMLLLLLHSPPWGS
jgi:hypothetical protein